MLQLFKNQVVTSVAKQQVEIRQLELDWYTNNYWTLSQQGALLAGFAFAQMSTTLPESTSFLLESAYLVCVTVSMGMQLCVVVITTLCCMWGPGLALRGPHGTRSVNDAVDNLRMEQTYVFAFFVSGLFTFYTSNILRLWCFFEEWVALVSTIILSIFLLLILYYTCMLTFRLRVTKEEAVCGRVEALKIYEGIVDLDNHYSKVSHPAAQSSNQLFSKEAPAKNREAQIFRETAQFSSPSVPLLPVNI
ncbi:hypothetical protein IE077_001045 [Cardiosporidium cionae]|uniref:Uncharacterized protein n=1 Tax=Cardiosporidium cionae TaxID=476202 RepID=A0ABQ7JDM7_9APIC|nr:hypothetical protein IE077_001045 [Cardiosporidium cionae]|eukprot:KAF8822103.1 hypothetical protein IE077_001045 [Cardiosporidium cionae]